MITPQHMGNTQRRPKSRQQFSSTNNGNKPRTGGRNTIITGFETEDNAGNNYNIAA